VLLMSIVGIYSMQGIKSWNVALLGPHIPVWGFLAAIGVALAIVHTNAMNLYPSTVDLLVALNTFRKPHRWEQPIATVLLGVLATLLAVGGILSHVQNFLGSIGDVVFPFTFVMLADWLFIQRRQTPTEAFFERPRGLLDWFAWPGAVAFALGFVISAWGDRFLPAFFSTDLPLPVVGSLIAAAVYVVLAMPLRRQLTHEDVEMHRGVA
jgi:purine-cytosine permease-like protein